VTMRRHSEGSGERKRVNVGKRIVLLGPPGAGKGTLARQLADELDVPHVATGDMLRAEVADGTDLGRRAKEIMDSGELVSGDIVVEMAVDRLSRPDATQGWILDGFPRDLEQAIDFERRFAGAVPDIALYMSLDKEEIIRRITGRRVCPRGHVYHVESNPPSTPGVCDEDELPLSQRDDDTEPVVAKRLEVYRDEIDPLVAHYDEHGVLSRLDSSGDAELVHDRALALVSGRRA
jgi:adenylate kinase